eukprot:3690421-Pleurochrysis_carterae.AAC.2
MTTSACCGARMMPDRARQGKGCLQQTEAVSPREILDPDNETPKLPCPKPLAASALFRCSWVCAAGRLTPPASRRAAPRRSARNSTVPDCWRISASSEEIKHKRPDGSVQGV